MFALLVLAVVLPAAAAAHPGHQHGAAPFDGRIPGQPDFERHGQGFTRFDPATGTYTIKREPGEPALSMHYDPVFAESETGLLGGNVELPTSEDAPLCATSGHRIVPVYLFDNFSQYDPAAIASIRTSINRMNWKLRQQSLAASGNGVALQMVVDCNAAGQVQVYNVQHAGAGENNAVETALGKPDGRDAVKYLVFSDGPGGAGFASCICGEAENPQGYLKSSSDEVGVGNPNRVLTTSAVLRGTGGWTTHVSLHELTHTVGASLKGPEGDKNAFATVKGHCTDGIDVLCYKDGADMTGGFYSETRCPPPASLTSTGVPLDCGYDTYFDSATESGEWLTRYWNTGGSENPFYRTSVPAPPTPPTPNAKEGDVDNDGFADLVTLGRDSTVRVYRGLLGRTFASAISSLTGAIDPAQYDGQGHFVVDVSDVTGDGRGDLVTYKSDSTLLVHPGTATSQFGSGVSTFLSGATPSTLEPGSFEPVAVADVTGDGRGDLVAFSGSANGLKAYPGSATGNFTGGTTSFSGSIDSAIHDQSGHYFIDAADVTGDGKADLVSMHSGGGVYVYPAQGTAGAFGTPTQSLGSMLPSLGQRLPSRYEPIGVGDVNGDGRADLVTLHNDAVQVHAGQANGSFAAETEALKGPLPSSFYHPSGEGSEATLLDVDGDGREDLILNRRSTGSATVYGGNADFTFSNPASAFGGALKTTQHAWLTATDQEIATEKPPLRRRGYAATPSDVNQDRRADLVSVHGWEGKAHVFPGEENGTSIANEVSSLSGLDPAIFDGHGNYVVDVADVTGEGRSDLITISDQGAVRVFPGGLSSGFANAVAALTIDPAIDDVEGHEPIGVGDLTDDGRADLVTYLASPSSLNIFAGEPGGTFASTPVAVTVSTNSALQDGVGTYFLGLADLNGDRQADITAIDSGGTVKTFSSNEGKFSGFSTSSVKLDPVMDNGVGVEPIDVGDLNGDGFADLLILDSSGQLKYHVGKGNGGFEVLPKSAYGTAIDSSLIDGLGEEPIGLLDFNRDGRQDLISSSTTDGDLLAYKGQSGTTPLAAPTVYAGAIDTTRLGLGGHEFAMEKPFWRRTTCYSDGCEWPPVPTPVESDVDGDRRSDLVTLRTSGKASVFGGGAEGIPGSGVTSLDGTIDSALYDDSGDYAVDSADVTGDKLADLVTVRSSGGIRVFPGSAGGTFGSPVQTSTIKTVMSPSGTVEPIGVANVTADYFGDLVGYVSAFGVRWIALYPGQANGGFGSMKTSLVGGVDSAFLDGSGEYFLDVADVDGDTTADLVSITAAGALRFYEGQTNGSFLSPVSSGFSLDPVMDDGSGYEPVGLGDVDRDQRADFAALDSATGRLFVFRGNEDGTFTPPSGWPTSGAARSGLDSSLTDSGGDDLVGLFDYSRDGRADLVSLNEDGDVLSYRAKTDGTFADPVVQPGPVYSNRLNTKPGQEAVAEKPLWRRAGCSPTGCDWPPDPSPGRSWTTDGVISTIQALADVDCVSATYCVAVGGLPQAAPEPTGSHAKAAVWDGSAWTETAVPVPSEAATSRLMAVSCVAVSECTAVGKQFLADKTTKTLTMRWDGSSWAVVPSPNSSEEPSSDLVEVSCTSSSFCMAVGGAFPGEAIGARGTLALRWDGTSWSVVPTPNPKRLNPGPSSTTFHLRDVACFDGTSCTAVGRTDAPSSSSHGFVMDYLSGAWAWSSQVPEPPGAIRSDPSAVTCASGGECWLAGSYRPTAAITEPLAMRRGSSAGAWTEAKTRRPEGSTNARLEGIDCSAPDSCVAVGTANLGSNVPLVLSWDGSPWSMDALAVPAEKTFAGLESVSCLPSGECSAVGLTGASGPPVGFAVRSP